MNPTAIILGMYGMNALGMLRSLAIEKIPTKMYHIRGKFPTAKYSKHANYFKIEKNKEALLERLLKDGVQQEDKGIIFATEDEHVLFCSENYEELEKYYDVPKIIGKEMIDCLNKKNILQFGVAAGFNVPKTYTLSEFSGQIDAPIVVKPINSLKYGKSAMEIYHDIDALINKRSELLNVYGEMVVQEYIEDYLKKSIDVQCYNSSAGHIIAGMHTSDDRMANPFGNSEFKPLSISLKSIWKEDLVPYSATLAKGIGFTGPLNFEVVESGGKYSFIEVNFRTSAYVYLDTMTGLNMPAIIYFDKAGKDFSGLLDRKRIVGMKMIREEREAYNLFRHKKIVKCYRNFSSGILSHYEKGDVLPLLVLPLEILKYRL